MSTATTTSSATVPTRPLATALRPGHPVTAVLTAQALASVGLSAGGAAGALLAHHVVGDPGVASVPVGSMVVGAALSAPVLASRIRRSAATGVAAGYLVAAAGALLVVGAAGLTSLPLLLLGTALLGTGCSASMLSRYVVAAAAPLDARGRALGRSLLALALGAVTGPVLLGPAGRAATWAGLPADAGLFALAVPTLLVAALVVLLLTSPTGTPTAPARPAATRTRRQNRPRDRSRGAALLVLGSANLTMVTLMAVLPSHLHGAGHGTGPIGLVVAGHVAAMYVASPVLGRWLDRHGPRPVVLGGAAVLVLVGVAAAATDLTHLTTASAATVALGIGWNAQLLGGSALLSGSGSDRGGARDEAAGEVVMNLGAALGCLVVAGPLLVAGGWELLAWSVVLLDLVVLGVLGGSIRPSGRRPRA